MCVNVFACICVCAPVSVCCPQGSEGGTGSPGIGPRKTVSYVITKLLILILLTPAMTSSIKPHIYIFIPSVSNNRHLQMKSIVPFSLAFPWSSPL